ncbi:MAG: fatty acid desaturase [Acidimicrobiia bacterium]|nr:fatty acid desaturase [Acidimicrobiia bacterium]
MMVRDGVDRCDGTTRYNDEESTRRTTPVWARRRLDRAIPDLDLPSLAELGRDDLLARHRRLAVLFVARIILALAGFAACLARGWWVGLAPATWVIYGGSLTAVHHLIHGRLGLSPRTREWLLTALAAVVTESGHALESTHLLHHETDADAPDPEGYIEHVPWRRMPIEAVRFRYRLMGWGLRHGGHRRRIRLEIAWHALVHIAAIAVSPLTWWPLAYVAAIAVASAGFAVMAGKGPQTNYGREVTTPLVIVRARFSRLAFFSHDRHLEHHAYPQVPLPRLRRLDGAIAPALERAELVEVRLP